ncbi:hypothetical protein [Cryobacterium sp. PH31-L1]|uniref:hypothetical protein n=1 Tax=Cryobacterium sp. PH31-L1 TaxID=3046199 RepID=UPI0024BAFEA4|nr:hypothetical protein [Cryobacterium sp. PH31-L1]MDJ0376969.1 hypothetical protein [Cryobacterium sp. PH31-L1]
MARIGVDNVAAEDESVDELGGEWGSVEVWPHSLKGGGAFLADAGDLRRVVLFRGDYF